MTWVYSSLLALHQQQSRRERIARAVELLQQLKERLDHRRCRLRTAAELERRIEQILERYKVGRYLKVRRFSREEHRYRQQRRGRPGPRTTYVRTSRRLLDIEWATDEAAVAYDCKSDGMYPLLSNDRSLTPLEVLQAHKGQPKIEKRFSQLKSVHEIAPGFLKNEGRIEALFTLYFLALMVQALIERELRRAMKREAIAQLPIYPEERRCHRPTTEQVLRLFSLAVRHTLLLKWRLVQAFGPDLTHLQTQILALLGVPPTAYGMAE